jgi:hypothetical protein
MSTSEAVQIHGADLFSPPRGRSLGESIFPAADGVDGDAARGAWLAQDAVWMVGAIWEKPPRIAQRTVSPI